MLAMVFCIFTVMGFGQGYLFELLSHFRLIYMAGLLGCLFLLLVGQMILNRSRWYQISITLLVIVALGINLWTLVPFYTAKPPVSASQVTHPFKILHINVLGVNRDAAAVEALIRQTRPDILTLAEYNAWWQEQLKQSGVLDRFTSAYVVKYGNDGVYSTIPFQDVRVDYIKPGKDPTTQVHFKLGNELVTLLVVHPRPPVKPNGYERNHNQFACWEKHWVQYGKNVLLIGDLNNSPWSNTFRHFIEVTGLHDSQNGFGVQPSWPVLIPEHGITGLIPLIPIDHVLHSDRFVVLSRKTGPRVGSDHLPVIVEMGFPAQ